MRRANRVIPAASSETADKAAKPDKQQQLLDTAKRLARRVDAISFGPPVTHVYNPLRYAWKPHRKYLMQCSVESTRVLFLGMNPGPWGMTQTGVPFGQIEAVRDWLGIEEPVDQPQSPHPKRAVEGFACKRSEVSGQRLWGLFKSRFATPREFFEQHFVVNYCPLVFMEASGKNRTPDKLAAAEMQPLQAACDQALQTILSLLRPSFCIGVGAYAEACLRRVTGTLRPEVQETMTTLRILHPSPASPAANRNWAEVATSQLIAAGVWQP